MPLQRMLSDKQILEARSLFFYQHESYKKIQQYIEDTYALVPSIALLRKVIHGQGSYAALADDIPQEKKNVREPARVRFSIKRSKEHSFNVTDAERERLNRRKQNAIARKRKAEESRKIREFKKWNKYFE